MQRIALGLEYRGDGFCGWQSQPDGCAVQDALERALSEFVAQGVRYPVTCAGRTDAGVHALEQVVHFDADVERDDNSWVRGVNCFLPATVRVRWARPVDASFHARFSAISRTYRYWLLVDRSEPAILKSLCGWYHLPLDVARMEQACALLVGRHDFTSFRAAECQAKSPVKTLHEARVAARGPLVEWTFRADAFLHHMVRNMVGALIQVG
ncbi:MAG TPA: tRNA pseudouridine(38-40) synthase TruA, partial [Usitatibacteraceae bacterium]|nr:tRNA pseudouridine(38-40) synthase TruA [Usitatibacteraceae bacterium]